MKLKVFTIAALIIGILAVFMGLGVPLFFWEALGLKGSEFAIIGNADVPTFRVVYFRLMNGLPFCLAVLGGIMVIAGLFCLFFSKTVRYHCMVMTSVIALSLSAVGGFGLNCGLVWFTIAAFHDGAKYPVAYPMSVGLGMASLMAFGLLLAAYCWARKKRWSWKGFVIDVLTAILYVPFFFLAFSYLIAVLGG